MIQCPDNLAAPHLHRLALAPLLLCALAMAPAPAQGAPARASCRQGSAVHIWTAPLKPRPGKKLELMAVATDGVLSTLAITDPGGRRSALPAVSAGGPPWSLRANLGATTAGTYRVEVERDGKVVACTTIRVGRGTGDRGSGKWDAAAQAFFAAWVEHLFDAPPDQSLGFASLEPVLRDPARNLLFDYLREGEDLQTPANPDCADLSYFLRAYFAWKLGLPMASRGCDRGTATRTPRCGAPTIDTQFVRGQAPSKVFKKVSLKLMDRVTSGGGRTALADEESDFYPVPLKRSALWPGTVYADPYGHTLMIVKWVPQTRARNGMLLAVDAQPDNSVGRKRFWEGNFLFARTASAGPGFKAWRPPLPGASGMAQAPRPTGAQAARLGLPPYSTEQAGLSPADFYARIERLINPLGLDPQATYNATLEALMEQLETRVRSVDRGEAYMKAHPGQEMAMPTGPAIFETVGPWEDYATPSRDMRILIALKVLAELPDRIRHHPELFVLGGQSAADAAKAIEKLHAQRAGERAITYTRTDGSPYKLSLAEVYNRRKGLEMGYNPNDCVELRWGAPTGSPDLTTCVRKAPAAQRARMEAYRPWFRETRRPPR